MWQQLKDIDIEINDAHGQSWVIVLRITKDDNILRPGYSWCLGTRKDPQPFRPFVRANAATMGEVAAARIGKAMQEAALIVASDRATHLARIDKAESERVQALAGKRQGDPNAGKGLSRFKRKKEGPASEVLAKAAVEADHE